MTTRHSDSVRIVLFDEADPERFLVVDESDDLGNYKLPGGKFEDGESADEAAGRELKEEIGLTAEDVALQAVSVLVNQHDPTSKRHIYKGRVAAGKVIPTSEVANRVWVTRETVPESENRGHIIAALGQVSELPEPESFAPES